MVMEEFLFRVEVTTSAFECVCLSTDLDLPAWTTEGLRQMERAPGSDIWEITLRAEPWRTINYRYAVCIFEHGKVAVINWETHQDPRVINSSSDRARPPDIYGVYNDVSNIDRGWLVDQTEIIVKLYDKNPIRLLKPLSKNASILVKCRPVDMRSNESNQDDESINFDLLSSLHKFKVYVASLRNIEDSCSHLQSEYGEVFNPQDFMVFRTQSFCPESLGYIFDFHTCVGDDRPTYIGQASMMPPAHLTSGVKSVSIFGVHNKIIGEVTLDFLYITPSPMNICTLKKTNANYWPHKRQVMIGHRGMGTNKNPSRHSEVAPENTIAALSMASKHGMHFVEFDIQLTKDNQVVLYHDFTVCLSSRKKFAGLAEVVEVPVKDLTYSQLSCLKLVPTGHDIDDKLFHEDNPEDWKLFPTLGEAFDRVDEKLGFVIEMKYPMALANGGHEMKHFVDHDSYVDTILDCILTKAGDRELILTCFDPDICSALRCKQNLYPVIFTCQGLTPVFPEFYDTRARRLDVSLWYGIAEDALGISAIYDEILANPHIHQEIHARNKVLFVWGDQHMLSERASREGLKTMGVQGIIYDTVVDSDKKTEIFVQENVNLHPAVATGIVSSFGNDTLVHNNVTSTDLSETQLSAFVTVSS